jgi:hypothetical protein
MGTHCKQVETYIRKEKSPFVMVSAFHCQVPGCPSKKFYLLLERWHDF